MTDPTSTTTADTTRVALAPTPSNAARLGHAIAILIAASIVWFSAGDHALYPPDEGRYGVVSAGMAERGGWLIPEYRGEPHLTKPVLAYWCQALAIRALGRGELAVRLPSLIATSLLVLVVYGAGRRLTGSRRIALIGAVTYAVMPLPMMVGRLATTDAMLALPWFVALVAGWGAATTGRLAPAALLWFAVAVGLLVKGPLAFMPVGIVMLWLLLGGRRREIRRLRPVLGPLLALGPLATWAAIVLWQHPDAVAIWRHEVLDRATGASDHVEPVWFYAPIFLTGLFPATAFMVLPVFNLSWRDALRALRAGDVRALLLLAVIIPLAMFTALRGKMPTYLLPLAAPMAILAAGTIDRWIDQRRDEFTRLPDVAVTLTACATLMAGAAGVGLWMYAPESVWSAAPLVVLPLAGLGLLIAWRRTPAARRRAVACAGAAAIIAWAAALEIEDRVRRDSSPLDLIATIRHDAGGRTPTIGVYGIYDPTLVYYLDAETDTVALDTAQGRRAFLDSPSRAYVLVDARTWSDLNADGRLTDEGFDVIDAFRRWFDRETLVIAERHVDHP